MQRSLHPAPASRCSQCVGLHVRKPLKGACALSIPTSLKTTWPYMKPVFTWHCFAQRFLLPFSYIFPWCQILPMPVWLQNSLNLTEPPQMQTQSFGKTLAPPFFLLPVLHNAERHALLLSASKFDARVTCSRLGAPKMHSKSYSIYCLLLENILCFLEPYWSIRTAFFCSLQH